MTREAYTKHKEVIEWWSKGRDKEVWARDTNGSWFLTDGDVWFESYDYVQNDKYSEFRKAEIENEDLEFLDTVDNSWTPYHTRVGFGDHTGGYRTKPEEPKFGIGDWVSLKGKQSFFIATKDWLDMVNGDFSYELWKPVQGKFCVMYNRGMVSPFYVVVRFNKLSQERYYSEYGENFTNVAPIEFIQTLKGLHED